MRPDLTAREWRQLRELLGAILTALEPIRERGGLAVTDRRP
jgi:hypothetical protein